MSQVQTTSGFQIIEFTRVAIQAVWEGLDSTDGQFVVEGSVDGVFWNVINSDDNPVTIASDVDDVQIWEVEVSTRFLRLKWTPVSNTSGTASVILGGYRA